MSSLIKKEYISEKATQLQKNDCFVFEIAQQANKSELKKQIEEIFKVDVKKINIVNLPHKKTRRGLTSGLKSRPKKAIVKIKHGQKIDFGKIKKSRKK